MFIGTSFGQIAPVYTPAPVKLQGGPPGGEFDFSEKKGPPRAGSEPVIKNP